ncbi:hypothetical protein BWI96_10190 [Siphonobacter sp. SORGH_AS_0500]|nr:hypothetical protein BWI96_10190 [Siphonobacter sp. SORGH_AS_0500]
MNGGNLVLTLEQLCNQNSTSLRRKRLHQDDYYLFFLQESGSLQIALGFQVLELKQGDMLCVSPGQLHAALSATDSVTWVLSVVPALLSINDQAVFRWASDQYEPLPLPALYVELLIQGYRWTNELARVNVTQEISQQLRATALQACLRLLTVHYEQRKAHVKKVQTRPELLIHSFQGLVAQSFRTVKSPAAYASLLHVSASYLNEACVQVTGHPPGYWIQQQILEEAKRSLGYSELSVKEIAYALGYTDVAYFSRVFTRLAGVSPSLFRQTSRK